MNKKKISVITPCFNEEENVEECYQRLKVLFDDELAGYEREHIFCDNASTDNTLEILKKIASDDKSVKIIVNARNFGPMRNNYNGIMQATGDLVLLFLPADLQDPPELLPAFVRKWEAGYEIVYGIRANREEGAVMSAVRRAYYKAISRLSYVTIPPNVGDFQLVDRKVLEAMKQFDDAYPFTRIMTFECGFRSTGIPYTWEARKRGMSKNRLHHLIDQGLNGLITFSNSPLRAALFSGFFLAGLSILYALITAFLDIFVYENPTTPGIPTLIVAVFFFSGVQLFFVGLLGEYVLAIYGQVRKKPMVIERERINFD